MSTIDNTDPNIDLKDLTIETCYNSGLGDLIDDIVKDQELLTFEDKSSIPIPPDLLQEGSIEVEIDESIQQLFINKHIQLINNPQTAFEYPFLMTGKQSNNKITNFTELYSNGTKLKNSISEMSTYSKRLYEEILNSKKRGDNIIIEGHTHPKPSLETIQNRSKNTISETLKEKYGIRELGLNLSLQDLYFLVYFEQAIKGTAKEGTKAMINVLMFNGNSVYVYIENGNFKKAKVKQKGGTTAPPS